MTDLRKAAQQALEALEAGPDVDPIFAGETEEALRAALAQQPEPVQEPVAKVELMTTGGNAGLATRIVEIDDHLRERLRPGQQLYTAPPQRPRLTDEEIVEAVREADLDWQAGWTLDEHEPNRFTTLARAIDRKVRGEA